MKDLYKRLGIDPSASRQQIREAISSGGQTADAAALQAAEFVLLDAKRRKVYDRTYRVLLTIGDLRSHLGLNFKTFWARSKLRDFTHELAAPQGRQVRRTIRSLGTADIRRAFGLHGGEPGDAYESGKQRLLVVACVLVAMALIAGGVFVYFATAR